MRTLNHYLRNSIIGSTTIVMLVLLGLESFMELVNELSVIGHGHYGMLQAFIYVPLQLPTDMYQLFPMAGFLGSLIGLGRMASNSELIVMRSSGVSVTQIAWSVIKAALLMIVVVTIIGEWWAPQLRHAANQIKARALGKTHGVSIAGVWLRHKNDFIHINRVNNSDELQDVTRYHFNDQHQLLSTSVAVKGVLQKDGQWLLKDIKQTTIGAKQINTELVQSAPLGVVFKPSLLQQKKRKVAQDSAWNLWHKIQYRGEAGLVTSQYEFLFWQRIFQPLTTIVMIILGIPFIFGSLRSASMGSRILIGVIIGFGFYMLNQFFGPITLVYQFPPLLAATVPMVLFLFIYALLIRRVR